MRIGKIARLTGLTISKLRYYEKHGLIRVARDKNGLRNYAEDDIAWIKFIQRLKDTGMLIRDIKKYAELRYNGDLTIPERLEMLQVHRQYVLKQQQKWQDYLQNLDDKIEIYKSKLNEVNI